MALKAPMILVTGKQFGKSPTHRVGFTLIEIVLVLGLMAFAAAIVITNFASLADRGDSQSSVEILQSAVRQARYLAASERSTTELRFDKETGSLIIASAAGTAETFALDKTFDRDGPGVLLFYLVPPAEGLNTAPAPMRTRLETSHVEFAPDRSSSPFAVNIDTGSGTPERLIFDPFSSLLITPE